MIVFEIVLAVFSFIGFILVSFQIPGGIALFSISVLMLALVHYLLGFALFNGINLKDVLKQDFHKKNKLKSGGIVAAVLTGWGFAEIEVGVLFKVVHWPGENLMITAGLISVFLAGLFLLFQTKDKKNIFLTNLVRIIILLTAGIIALLVR